MEQRVRRAPKNTGIIGFHIDDLTINGNFGNLRSKLKGESIWSHLLVVKFKLRSPICSPCHDWLYDDLKGVGHLREGEETSLKSVKELARANNKRV